MKDYMESGSFSRGREEITALASMVFLGNISLNIDHIVRTSHLFTPFPPDLQDLAFLDRLHLYLPGWEIPKLHPKHLTHHYGFIIDYLAEFLKDSRKISQASAIEEHFELGSALNQRDKKAVRKIISGLIKLLHPDGAYTQEELERYLNLALEMRRRVKEQLKRMGGVEFWNTNFSYSDFNGEVRTSDVPEMVHGIAIPGEVQPPGIAYAVAWDAASNRSTLFRIEVQLMKGTGSCRITGALNRDVREEIRTVHDYLRANWKDLGAGENPNEYDFHVQLVNLMLAREPKYMNTTAFLAMLSALKDKPMPPSMAIIGAISVTGAPIPIQGVAESLQLVMENGGKTALLPSTVQKSLATVPKPILEKIKLISYNNGRESARKTLE